MKKFLVTLMLVISLFGCGTTAFNIKSVNELSGGKMLTGRFMFYNNDTLVESGQGFIVFFKERHDKTLRQFVPDEKGYVYTPVDEGQYDIVRIMYSELQGHLRFPIAQSSGINIDASDTIVNFGTIQVNFQQDVTSRIAYITTYGYPYTGKLTPTTLKPELSITQIPDWDVIRQYISSKLDILPESIRDEVVHFQQT